MEGLKAMIGNLDKETLVQKLMGSGYAFAYWRMPQSDKKQFIISFSSPSQKIEDLSSLEQGFLINQYQDTHPPTPTYIKADIIFDKEVYIHPKVSASQLDEFRAFLDSKSTTKIDRASPLPDTSREPFLRMVDLAVQSISEGRFEKVVLSRVKKLSLPEDFSAFHFFEKLCSAYENAFCSLVNLPSEGVWIGATPELLISNNSERFKTIALAGTKVLENEQPLSEIAWTQKEIEEQAFVSRYIINCFKKIRLREFHEHGPKTIKAGNLAHLKTEFQVNYDEVEFDGLADQMINLLHPTSAVCGMPLQDATDFISKHEVHDRSYYSGFLGPVNFEGATNLFVNLRCMQVIDSTAQLYAGAGITQDSDSEKECTETELKMDTLMSLIR